MDFIQCHGYGQTPGSGFQDSDVKRNIFDAMLYILSVSICDFSSVLIICLFFDSSLIKL